LFLCNLVVVYPSDRGDVVINVAEAATKMFGPMLEAIKELSDEFSGSSGIMFSTLDPPNGCAIYLGTKIRSYTINILCSSADTVEDLNKIITI
jgi:hypothetical protein